MRIFAFTALAAAVGLLSGLTAPGARAANPDAIWHVVHDQCVTDMTANHKPAPCDAVDLAGGYAVLKDLHGATQLLLIPTDRITGIEAPQVLAPGAKNYWQDAWAARPYLELIAKAMSARAAPCRARTSPWRSTPNTAAARTSCISISTA
jgi:CDP-diacylglycerol pyrophosphatase